MAEYLVHAVPLVGRMPELARRLRAGEFRSLRPFGRALTESLTNARVAPDGRAVWEEEDYCSPPLAEERAAVLDHYFRELEVDRVGAGEGWRRIADLPRLFEPTGDTALMRRQASDAQSRQLVRLDNPTRESR